MLKPNFEEADGLGITAWHPRILADQLSNPTQTKGTDYALLIYYLAPAAPKS